MILFCLISPLMNRVTRLWVHDQRPKKLHWSFPYRTGLRCFVPAVGGNASVRPPQRCAAIVDELFYNGQSILSSVMRPVIGRACRGNHRRFRR
jgi:hypothetical protein